MMANIFDTANCFLEFQDKSFAYINVSWFSPQKKRIIQIDTNKAISLLLAMIAEA